MPANATNPGSSSLLPTPSAPDADITIPHALNSIMIGHTFLILLLAVLIALFYSTPCSRRNSIFILNVAAIVIAFAAGVMIDAHAIHSILDPRDPWPTSVDVAIGIIGVFQSILVDTVLLLRLISIQPLWRLGPTRFALLILLPVLLKIARLANVIIFIRLLAQFTDGPLGSLNVTVVWTTTPYLKIEWAAQAADNIYASLALLWILRDWGHMIMSNAHPRVPVVQRIHTLARLTLSTFILPTALSIALVIAAYLVDVSIVLQIARANGMLAVIGVVFASVWADGRRDLQIELWEDDSDKSVGVGTIGSRVGGVSPYPIWLGYHGPAVSSPIA